MPTRKPPSLLNIRFKSAQKQLTKFLQETLTIAIEKERIHELRTILALDTSSKSDCQTLVNTLRTLTRKKPSPLLLVHLRDTTHTNTSAYQLKKTNWRRVFIGRVDPAHRPYNSTPPDNLLHYACRHGKTCLIDLLVEEARFNINQRNRSPEQDTPVSIAVDLGWLDTVKFLVSRGGRVNTENARFKTPLILATELKYPYDVGMCRLLLDSGAHVNWTTRNRNTVMFSACKFGNLELMEVLLSRGGDLNVQSKDGASPLMHACYYNCLEMVGFLLRHSAQIEMRNLRHETALYIAAFRGHFKIVQLLVSSLYS